ncbi:MAG: DNRLRE domain-containing protein, partial [Anaerolineales bacterium]|nr:DNRLRE domain-containing protein [Anaerolineales bacterium]
WSTQPALLSGGFDNKGAIAGNTWVEYDVTALVSGNGTYTFALIADGTDGVTFSSREGTAPPELVVTLGTGSSGATNTPTATPTSTATLAASSTPTPTQTASTATPTNTPTPTATVSAPGGPLTFITVADARVYQGSPTTNYGYQTNIQADAGPGTSVQRSYLRFDVSGISGPIESVKLRVYCTTNGTVNGPAAYLADNTWIERGTGGVTWNTQPALLSGAFDNKGAIAAASWVEYDVTALVTGDGTYTFALVADSYDGVTFSSREGSFDPELVVTLDAGALMSMDASFSAPIDMPIATQTPAWTPTSADMPASTDTAMPAPTDTPAPTATPADTPSPTPTVSLPGLTRLRWRM